MDVVVDVVGVLIAVVVVVGLTGRHLIELSQTAKKGASVARLYGPLRFWLKYESTQCLETRSCKQR